MRAEPLDDATRAGQAVYTRTTLALYDALVLGLSNAWIWRCPTREILALYDSHVSEAHLDVGVGTGWYLDHCRFPTQKPRVGLLDLNPHALTATARRIARYRPESYRADMLAPLVERPAPFRSIALTYLLHCLPGPMARKAAAFDHLLPWLAPGGVVFGATLLTGGVSRSAGARRLMRLYNAKGIFSNEADDAVSLRAALTQRFAQVEIRIVGCGALFIAREPRQAH